MPSPSELALSNSDAEQALLGAVLINPDAFYQVSHFVESDLFWVVRHGWIWDAMESILARGDSLDYISLNDELRQRGQLEELGGPAYITLLMNHTPTSIYAETYARIVERAAVRRRMLNAASTIARLAHDEEHDITATLDLAHAALADVSAGRQIDATARLEMVATDYLEALDAASDMPGIPTGYADIDRRLGGLQRSDLIVIAGRPGMGKTAWMHGAALHAAQRARVLIFSMEMNKVQVLQRLIALETGVSTDKQRRGRLDAADRDLVTEAAFRLSRLKLWIDDTPALTPSQVEAKARRVYNEHGLDLVIIDYVQLMTAPGGREQNRVQELAIITRSLKNNIARAMNVPVLVAAQLNRAVEQRQDKHPQLSDLRESGSIENDADVVMFIYRDEVYNEGTEHPNEAEIITAKHRNGPTGTDVLYFLKEQAKFGNLRRHVIDLEGYDS